MRQCIFCKAYKEEKEFNIEHIFFDALGGKGGDNTIMCVCKMCNSSLGTNLDACFLTHRLTELLRFSLKIKGRNGVPNPFRGVKVNYADTDITGELLMDKNGKLSGYRADRKVIKDDDRILILSPRKNFHGYVNSELKKHGYNTMQEDEIDKWRLDIKNPKIPRLDYVYVPEEFNEQYAIHAFPALLKMSYEYCYSNLGDKYLEDCLAEELRKFMIDFQYREIDSYDMPTDARFEIDNQKDWLHECSRVSTLTMRKQENVLYVDISMFDVVKCSIVMSKDADRYGTINSSMLKIEV